ncbi:polysaccharide deacetylase family protein [Paenibacillus sp. PR3]|uniref:Polysaccharide deacetylase family protein n=1 Tax=Paenibacillus terricola TaxID=2763503 RepID=A0ABR8MXH0_9BACL|nr:polysaccharide deacetylase family protein [Paenibacillus terricola]MBD3920583.1 polysaccharide deacetylase family protein [Paenibacillus terricola]
MAHNTIPMVELLSLKQSSNRYQMEIAITRGGGEAHIDWFELDDFTYGQLSLLHMEDYRMRLSLYAKWDPYKRHYYSTIVRMKGTFQETLYFICSNTYIQGLSELRKKLSEEQPVTASSTPEADQAVNSTAPAAELMSKQLAKQLSRRRMLQRSHGLLWKASLLSLVLLLAMMFRMQELSFVDKLDAINEHSSQSARTSYPSMVVEAAVNVHAAGAGSANKVQIEPFDTAVPQSGTSGAAKPDSKTDDVQTGEQQPSKEQPSAGEKQPAKTEEPPKQTKEAASNASVQLQELKSDGYTYSLPKGYVALTFDDGPSAYTKQIVDILKDNGIAGTFLFIGKNASRHQEEVRYAVEQGMSVGNHSWDHSKLTKLSDKSKLANIAQTNEELISNGAEQVTLFRPPYGLINSALAAQVKKQNMKVLMWNRDPEDWNADTRDEILDYFEKVNPSGGIYVLHEKKHTVEALPAIIEYLNKKKLKFVIFK